MSDADAVTLDLSEILATYSAASLRRMWVRVLPRQQIPKQRDGIQHELLVALCDERLVRARFEECSAAEQLALRLVLDCGEVGMSSELLRAESDRLGNGAATDLPEKLAEKGLVLAVFSDSYLYGDRKLSIAGKELQVARLYVHPALEPVLDRVQVPGEATRWSGITQPIGTVTPGLQSRPQELLDNLASVLRMIEDQPLLLTKDDKLRSKARKKLRSLTPFRDEERFLDWLALASVLGVAERDERSQYWRPGPRATKLVTEPLVPLYCLLSVAAEDGHLCHLLGSRSTTQVRYDYRLGNTFWYLADRVAQTVILALQRAAASFLEPGAWFCDQELWPLLGRLARRCNVLLLASSYSPYWIHHLDLTAAEQTARQLVPGVLDALAATGMLERGNEGDTPVSRLTRLGSWLLQQTACDAGGAKPYAVAPGARWLDGQHIALSDPADEPFLELALGSLGTRTGPGVFRIDGESVRRTMEAGEPSEEILLRLQWLVPGAEPPAGLVASIREAGQRWSPVEITTDLMVLEFPSLSADELQRLSGKYRVHGNLVLCSNDRISELLQELGLDSTRALVIDYSLAPRASCRLGSDLELAVTLPQPCDLRLAQLLEDLGAPAGADRVRLDPDTLPGIDQLDDRELERFLKEVLRRLEPHVVRGVSKGFTTRFMAGGGAVDAPKLEERMLLSFDEATAAGLQELRTLATLAEPLSGGRFLLLRKDLARVEEKLAEIGIPFPAEHSSLRETVKVQAALGRLEDALAATAPEPDPIPAATPEPSPPPSQRSRSPRRKTRRPCDADPALVGEIIAAIGAASRDGGRGATLGDVAATTDRSREELQPVLRQLVRQQRITLSGHARGARYRTPAETTASP